MQKVMEEGNKNNNFLLGFEEYIKAKNSLENVFSNQAFQDKFIVSQFLFLFNKFS